MARVQADCKELISHCQDLKKSKYHFDISEQLKRETKSSRADSQLDHVTKTSLKISSQVENAKDERGIIPSPV